MNGGALTTTRDMLRLSALQSLVVGFAESLGGSLVVGGSYAVSLHMRHAARLPNDLDFITDDPLLVPLFLRECDRLSAIEFPAERVALFSGEIQSVEKMVAVVDGDRPNQLIDLIACHLALVARHEIKEQRMHLGGGVVSVVEFSLLLANKLHALWKVRTTGVVSTRVRDLYDLARVWSTGEYEDELQAAASLAAGMGSPRDPLGSYPREWIPAWRDLNRASGTTFSIDEVWRELERFAREVP